MMLCWYLSVHIILENIATSIGNATDSEARYATLSI